MRLLYVFPQYPAETFAVAEVEALRARGVDVRPVTLRGGRARLTRAQRAFGGEDPLVEVIPAGSRRFWKGLARVLRRDPLWFLGQVARAIAENRARPGSLVKSLYVLLKAPGLSDLAAERGVDLVHVFWGHYPSLAVPVLKRRDPARPVSAFLGAYAAPVGAPSQKRVLRQADCLTTHFDADVEPLRRWAGGRTPVALVYRGLDLDRIRGLRGRLPGAPLPAEPCIGIVSRLTPDKTVGHGLRAFALLRRRRPELRLEVIGAGPEAGRLAAFARALGVAGGVTFRGRLPHPATLAAMARHSVLLIPSLSPWDFYPNAMKEAMALAVPCAAYAIPGIAAFATTGAELRLARPGRIEELAQGVADLLDDGALRERTTAAAWVRLQVFDLARTAARQVELFRALARAGPLPAWVREAPGAAGAVRIRACVESPDS
jgi:glycosyltransferase involved in cell wall biosynthesis